MKKMNFRKCTGPLGIALASLMAGSVFAQDPVNVSLSEEVDAADATFNVTFSFEGNGQSQSFQGDFVYDDTNITSINLDDCGSFSPTLIVSCAHPGGDQARIRIGIASSDGAAPDLTRTIAFTLDGMLQDGDQIPLMWNEDLIELRAEDPIAEANATDGLLTVLGDPGDCELSIDPISHDFGNVDAGDVVHHIFIVSNTGTGSCGNLMAVATPEPPFGIDPLTDECSGANLAVGASCEVDVAFGPTADGNFDGTLTVTADGGASETASLEGSSGDVPPPPPAIGVPTLQAWGLALMALLMLTIGVFSVRTFRS